jgi:hypothetical protein
MNKKESGIFDEYGFVDSTVEGTNKAIGDIGTKDQLAEIINKSSINESEYKTSKPTMRITRFRVFGSKNRKKR